MSTPVVKPVRLLVIALAVFGVALLSGGTAAASCGDYLTIKNPKPGTATTTDEMPADHSPKAPCHGPNCSLKRVPDQSPLSSTPFNVSAPVTDAAALDTRAGDTATASARWRLAASQFTTVIRPFAPFHPPKSV